MSLDHLWAGWRSSYVSSFGEVGAVAGAAGTGAPVGDEDTECVFCRIVG